ncbi:anti sigma factor C-terminal domain-containing protein [Lysinibacillus pakistanensis]|uniref:anti-sigma factor n=1 Tax=Lysinibacillus pakistanensis TaxID=759811 RepID=UPI003D2BC80B
MIEWSQEKEKKILQKYRFTLTFRILRILLLCAVIYGLYILSVSIIFEKTRPDRKHIYNSLMALEWQQPNIKGQYSGSSAEITPLLTQKFSYPLVKQVGKENVMVGEMSLDKKIFNTSSSMKMNLTSKNSSSSSSLKSTNEFDKFSFNLPEDPRTGKATSSQINNGVWKTLEKLPEGTVAELAFSTTTFMEPKKLTKMLETYDVEVVWMPIYTGEFKSFDPFPTGEDSVNLTIYDSFGLSGGLKVSDDYSKIWVGQNLTNGVKDSQRVLLENMEKLLNNEKKSYIEDFLGLSYLQERYDYLKKNGFQAYGAVVTGPTKELLKLKNIEGVSNQKLGDVELWNWDNW